MNGARLALLLSVTLLGAADSRSGAAKTTRTFVRVVVGEQDPPLDRKSFTARLDGSAAKVLRVQGREDDMVLMLVLDLSGEPTLIDAARESLIGQIGQLAPNHWVGVMKAQDALQALVDPTADREKVNTAIRDYAATGKAGLLTTIEAVAGLGTRLMDRSGVRVAVLYITDSNIYNYREDYTNPVINSSDSRDLSRRFPDQLIKNKIETMSGRLARLEAPLYIVQLNYLADPINEAYRRGVLQLAEESGGGGAFCRSRGEIATAVENALKSAVHHWSVAVELKATKARSVTVILKNGDREIPNRERFALGK